MQEESGPFRSNRGPTEEESEAERGTGVTKQPDQTIDSPGTQLRGGGQEDRGASNTKIKGKIRPQLRWVEEGGR